MKTGRRSRGTTRPASPGHGLARILSKRGICSRSEAEALIRAGRVSVKGQVCLDPERRTPIDAHDIRIDGQPVGVVEAVYLMLYKPRGLVTTRQDERGRPTVYECLASESLPWLAPVGRLDQASEGLLLFTNDSAWAAAITAPGSHVEKVYHVQIDQVADEVLLTRLRAGVIDDGESLTARRVNLLRSGGTSSWLEIVLTEGRNRQIRRMLSAFNVDVLRLVRTSIGPLSLGTLRARQWRRLSGHEVSALSRDRSGS